MRIMNIVLDGTVLQQEATGIAKTLSCLYDSCYQIRPSLKIKALHRLPLVSEVPQSIHPFQLSPKKPEIFWRNLFLPFYINRNKIDVVHFPWNGNVPPFINEAMVITTIHDVLPLEIPGYFLKPSDEKRYLKKTQESIDRSSLIVTVSEYSKEQIMENFRVKNEPVVVYHGPTLHTYGTKQDYHENSRKNDYFLYVGGYDKRKGIETLLKIFIKLHEEKNLQSKLILTGSMNYFSPQFKRLVDEGVKHGFVEEKGYVSDSELLNLYSNALALVYPSKYEGFGLPPLEAMNMGCPVITTDCTSIPEVCGKSAYYVDIDDSKAFSEALINLDGDSSLRDKLKKRGIKQASKFSWENSAKVFLNEIDGLFKE